MQSQAILCYFVFCTTAVAPLVNMKTRGQLALAMVVCFRECFKSRWACFLYMMDSAFAFMPHQPNTGCIMNGKCQYPSKTSHSKTAFPLTITHSRACTCIMFLFNFAPQQQHKIQKQYREVLAPHMVQKYTIYGGDRHVCYNDYHTLNTSHTGQHS